MASITSLLGPPRLDSNDVGSAFRSLSQWLDEVAKVLVSQGQTIAEQGGDAGSLDPANLPNPASSNIATAQSTANSAYTLASTAKALAQKFRGATTVTISGTATTADFTFTTAETDTSYFVAVTPTAQSASAAAGCNVVKSVTRATTKVTVTIGTAPGTGETVSFDVLVFRSPT